MGVFDRISNWLNTTGKKIYSGVRNGVSTGFNFAKNIGHTIGKVSQGIDSFLTQARTIPVVGELAAKLQSNPLYNTVKEGINTANQVIDKGDEIQKQVGSVLDNVIGKPDS